MEIGTVTSVGPPGRIQPRAGGAELCFSEAAVRGPFPQLGEEVEFERDGQTCEWAIRVRLWQGPVEDPPPAFGPC